jgi:hypothetical protein
MEGNEGLRVRGGDGERERILPLSARRHREKESTRVRGGDGERERILPLECAKAQRKRKHKGTKTRGRK